MANDKDLLDKLGDEYDAEVSAAEAPPSGDILEQLGAEYDAENGQEVTIDPNAQIDLSKLDPSLGGVDPLADYIKSAPETFATATANELLGNKLPAAVEVVTDELTRPESQDALVSEQRTNIFSPENQGYMWGPKLVYENIRRPVKEALGTTQPEFAYPTNEENPLPAPTYGDLAAQDVSKEIEAGRKYRPLVTDAATATAYALEYGPVGYSSLKLIGQLGKKSISGLSKGTLKALGTSDDAIKVIGSPDIDKLPALKARNTIADKQLKYNLKAYETSLAQQKAAAARAKGEVNVDNLMKDWSKYKGVKTGLSASESSARSSMMAEYNRIIQHNVQKNAPQIKVLEGTLKNTQNQMEAIQKVVDPKKGVPSFGVKSQRTASKELMALRKQEHKILDEINKLKNPDKDLVYPLDKLDDVKKNINAGLGKGPDTSGKAAPTLKYEAKSVDNVLSKFGNYKALSEKQQRAIAVRKFMDPKGNLNNYELENLFGKGQNIEDIKILRKNIVNGRVGKKEKIIIDILNKKSPVKELPAGTILKERGTLREVDNILGTRTQAAITPTQMFTRNVKKIAASGAQVGSQLSPWDLAAQTAKTGVRAMVPTALEKTKSEIDIEKERKRNNTVKLMEMMGL